MVAEQTHRLLLANRKTYKELRQLAARSPFSLREIEFALSEVQHYTRLEESIEIASRLNWPLMEIAMLWRLAPTVEAERLPAIFRGLSQT